MSFDRIGLPRAGTGELITQTKNLEQMYSHSFIPLLLAAATTTLTAQVSVEAIAPARMHYAGPSIQVTITGSGFTTGTNLQVFFDEHPATGVTIVNDNTLTCVVPECGPGLVDVQVVNSIGQHTLVHAFAYTPAVHTSGIYAPGGSILISCFQDPGEVIFGAYGHTEVAVAVPMWIGELLVWPPTLLFVIPAWPYPRFDLPMPIPASPSVLGTVFVFQTLVGPDILQGQGTFSNASRVVIQ